MKRITPRTCLWPLAAVLVCGFALSIGLTYRSNHHCYAGTCGEWLFPFQARLHVIVWYLWVSTSVTFLALRAFRPSIRSLVRPQLGIHMPILQKPMRISGILMIFWILSLYGILIGIWWLRLRDYFSERGYGLPGNHILAAIALTGHLADVTMGMVLLPVSRNSALASFFKLSPSTILTFHMVQAYVLFGLVLTHGLLYAYWASLYNRNPASFRPTFPVLNPTYLYHEVWPGNISALGVWRASLIFTGAVASLIMMAMFFTSLTPIRRKHFNLFYFTHLFGIGAVIVICLHASTMFYCTLPGLSMWLLDWGMRIYELSGKLDSRLESLGKGWYCLTLPLPRKRLSGCACHSPLAHFYIHHTSSSIREIHPFTTITHLASKKEFIKEKSSSISIQFLFRKSISTPLEYLTPGPSPSKTSRPQWTNRLASLVDDPEHMAVTTRTDSVSSTPAVDTTLRLEGPYFTLVTPTMYEHVLCLVAGTGLSGALAIGAAFRAHEYGVPNSNCKSDIGGTEATTSVEACAANPTAPTSRLWKTCTVVWSVREDDYIDMPFFEDLKCDGLGFKAHKTGKGHGRLDIDKAIKATCIRKTDADSGEVDGRGVWVYISGPAKFIEACEVACRSISGLEWFAARWD